MRGVSVGGGGGGRWEVKGAKAGAEDCRDIRNIRTGICNCAKKLPPIMLIPTVSQHW